MASACLAVTPRAHGVALTPSTSSRGHRGISPPKSSRHPQRHLVANSSKGGASDVVGEVFTNLLGFFKQRVDLALEDGDETAISRIVARSTSGGAFTREGPSADFATWAVDLSIFVRDPVAAGPIDGKIAARTERTFVTLEMVFVPRDKDVYPSRGAAFVTGSRFFATEKNGNNRSAGYWLGDEPGFFKFALPATTEIAVANTVCVPCGQVFFNEKIELHGNDDDDAGGEATGPDVSETGKRKSTKTKTNPRLVAGVAKVTRNVPTTFMGANYSGILAEFVIVGTFTARRRN